ncbi:MAG: UDP-N-acetylmuramoyl-tripeptide--D-alanyl-D-alanine ligase, partial [Comamonas sp.]
LGAGEGAGAGAGTAPMATPRAARGLPPPLRNTPARAGTALLTSQGGNWTAPLMASATEGRWVVQPDPDWCSNGPALEADPSGLMRMAVVRGPLDSVGMPADSVPKLLPFCSGIMTSSAHSLPVELAHLPLLLVEDVAAAVSRLGSHARSRFFGDVIGVTGSVGKTSMVAMLAGALHPLGVASPMWQGTALPLGVAAEMACMPRDASCWILEMAAEGMLTHARLVRPSVAVVTSLASTPRPLHGSLERMARKTSAIFSHMRWGGHAVLRRDMPNYTLIERVARARGLHVLSYGDHEQADVSLVAAEHGQVRALVQGEDVTFPLALPGRHMAVNALGVIATLRALELPLDVALRQFADMQPLPGRGQRFQVAVQDGGQATVIDDSASANPESMQAALALLAQAPCAPNQRVAVLGDMLELGAEGPRRHLDLEQALLQAAVGRVMLHGPLMRGLHERLAPHTPSQWFETLESLDQALSRNLNAGDWVLVKGSAAMGFQIVVDRLRAFA